MHTTIGQQDLEECRQQFGAPGRRRFRMREGLCYLNIKRPIWCGKQDELWNLFKHKQQVLCHGEIVWGHIVQANTLLFKPGIANCPASVVFCPDSAVPVNLAALSYAAKCMFDLKNTTPEEAELLEIANTLTDEMTRTFGVQVPKQFCNGFTFYEASTFITRKHLPDGVLRRSIFPLLISSVSPYYCFPLPSKYWSSDLIHYWHSSV